MNYRTIGSAVVTVGLILGTPLAAQKKPTRPALPVAVSFGDQALDGVRSDGGGPYVDGFQNVVARMSGDAEGNLMPLDTSGNSRLNGGRRLVIDLAANNAGAPAASLADVYVASRAVDFDGADNDLRSMAIGASFEKRLAISWAAGSSMYHLRWNGPAEGHAFVTFTCTARNSTDTECNGWLAAAQSGTLAGLYSNPLKGSGGETYVGAFSMPFSMTIDGL